MNFKKGLLSILFLLSFIPQNYGDDRELSVDGFDGPMKYSKFKELFEDNFSMLSEVVIKDVSVIDLNFLPGPSFHLQFTATVEEVPAPVDFNCYAFFMPPTTDRAGPFSRFSYCDLFPPEGDHHEMTDGIHTSHEDMEYSVGVACKCE